MAALAFLAIAILVVLMVLGLWTLAYRVPMLGGLLALLVAIDGVDEWQRVVALHERVALPAIPIAIAIARIAIGGVGVMAAMLAIVRAPKMALGEGALAPPPSKRASAD